MTREEAHEVLVKAGECSDAEFPLLEAAIACAIHDIPFRDVEPVRALASAAAERLTARLPNESPDEALAEALSGDLRLTGDLLTFDDPANTDVIDVAERRRGISATLGVFYLHAARRCGLSADGVDFPNHFLLRVETDEGPVALDPFSQGRLVLPSELTRRALRAGLTPDAADRLDVLMAPVTDRQVLIRLQSQLFARASAQGDYEAAERSALRRALLDPDDHRPWLDVAAAREKQGALTGALEALARAQQIDGGAAVVARAARERVRLRLN
jgi:regulator of sirC expression with transglutaminase-like and TPR domain